MLPIALRIDAGAGPRMLVTAIDLDWLGARLRERDLAAGSAVSVADRDGVILAREPDAEDFVGKRLSEPAMVLAHARIPGTVELTSPDGTQRIVGYQPAGLALSDLFVGVGFSTDAAFAPVYRSTWRSLALAGIGAAAAFLLAWTVGDRLFRRPVRRILDTIASWRAGDETARIGIAPDAGELSILAAAIDEYMDSLVAVRAERAEAEERRTLLLLEMNHRIKNILAAVQAIANQTFKDRGSPGPSPPSGAVSRRWRRPTTCSSRDNWESADLAGTVSAAIDPFGSDGLRRFDLDGPPVQVTAKAALSLSMAIHELCTNAAKYGALAVPEGRVTVRWRLDGERQARRFHLAWREEGGPPVVAPGPPWLRLAADRGRPRRRARRLGRDPLRRRGRALRPRRRRCPGGRGPAGRRRPGELEGQRGGEGRRTPPSGWRTVMARAWSWSRSAAADRRRGGRRGSGGRGRRGGRGAGGCARSGGGARPGYTAPRSRTRHSVTAALPRAKQTIWRGRLGQSQISGSSMRPSMPATSPATRAT